MAGLTDRERDAGDERQVRVRLAERGRMLRQETGCIFEAVLAKSG